MIAGLIGMQINSEDGVRLNKCLPSLSRRAADEAIAAGRVTVNGNFAKVSFDYYF